MQKQRETFLRKTSLYRLLKLCSFLFVRVQPRSLNNPGGAVKVWREIDLCSDENVILSTRAHEDNPGDQRTNRKKVANRHKVEENKKVHV